MKNEIMKNSNEAYEVVSMKFKENVGLEEQKRLMEKLNPIVERFEGFLSREYFYSADNGRWIDLVVWSSLEHAKKASDEAMKIPEAGEIFAQIDETSMIFSHYKRIGGTRTRTR